MWFADLHLPAPCHCLGLAGSHLGPGRNFSVDLFSHWLAVFLLTPDRASGWGLFLSQLTRLLYCAGTKALGVHPEVSETKAGTHF